MTIVTVSNSLQVTEWVARRVGLDSADEFGLHTSIGFARNGRPIAGVVYNCFFQHPHGSDISATIAAERGSYWARPEVLRHMFAYPFTQLGCSRITVRIKEGNLPSEHLAKRLGFRKEGVMRRAWDGRSNALIYGLLKTECRWIDGQERAKAA